MAPSRPSQVIKRRLAGVDTHKATFSVRDMRAVLVIAAVVFALMLVIKDGRLLRQTGLSGSCVGVATPKGQTGSWVKCTSGKLQGAPNLSRQSCKSVETVGKVEYWTCPVKLQAGPNA